MYDDLTDEDIPEYMFLKSGRKEIKASGSLASKAKPSVSLVSKAKSSSSKAKASGSSPQTLIIPTAGTSVEQKKGKRKIGGGIRF
ncbi:hypothetical protein Tco_0895706 [Tanacetum coccineum]|uniref:Uncharacterized protein n=1 Tax=Tanacetum coccineum TaxID=301880 RepID=A0ABQ5CLL0_9ASTR